MTLEGSLRLSLLEVTHVRLIIHQPYTCQQLHAIIYKLIATFLSLSLARIFYPKDSSVIANLISLQSDPTSPGNYGDQSFRISWSAIGTWPKSSDSSQFKIISPSETGVARGVAGSAWVV